MINSAYSPIINQVKHSPHFDHIPQADKAPLQHRKKHWLLLCASKILICILCYHAVFDHKADRDVEIEEEETELVIMVNSSKKERQKKTAPH